MHRIPLIKFRRFFIIILSLYKKWISPFLPSACRFYPTCSEYAMQAIEKYGVIKGSFFAFRRLLKCHPLHSGGFDPVL
jgi:putative membrane protein insertion efficiency factor